MAIKETKAERIFRKTFCASKRHINTWGFDDFDCWNSLYTNEDDIICRRTVNAVLKECDKKEKYLNLGVKIGRIDPEVEAIERKALEVVRNTCANWSAKWSERF